MNCAWGPKASVPKLLLHSVGQSKPQASPTSEGVGKCSPSVCRGDPGRFRRERLLLQQVSHTAATCYFYSAVFSRHFHVDPYIIDLIHRDETQSGCCMSPTS